MCPTVSQLEDARLVAAGTHVLARVREALQDPVLGLLLSRDYLPVFTESTPRSIHRVQSDVGILSGLQLDVMQYLVDGHAAGDGISLTN